MPYRSPAVAKLRALIDRAETELRLVDAAASMYPAVKSIETTAQSYRRNLAVLVEVLVGKESRQTKSNFRRGMKAEIDERANSILLTAWEDGGGDTDDIGAEEVSMLDEFINDQQSFVNAFSDWLTDPGQTFDDYSDRLDAWELSMLNFGQRMQAYAQGALGDPRLTYDGRPGEVDPCDECEEYSGQTHRLSWWERRGLTKRNGNDNYGCGRWDACQHHFYNSKGDVVID